VVLVLFVVVAFAGVTTVVGLPVPGQVRRYPTGELRDLAEHINSVCHAPFGDAHVDWLGSRVDYPSGAPMDLTDRQRQMLGSGAKVGCVGHAIS
jgi:hypothetical protein